MSIDSENRTRESDPNGKGKGGRVMSPPSLVARTTREAMTGGAMAPRFATKILGGAIFGVTKIATDRSLLPANLTAIRIPARRKTPRTLISPIVFAKNVAKLSCEEQRLPPTIPFYNLFT